MHIEIQRLVIRDFPPRDAADPHAIFGDAVTMENCEPAYSFEKTQRFLQDFCISRHGAVAAVREEHVIGYILFNEFDPGVYNTGWSFNRTCWRQEYAFEACRGIVDYAFGQIGAHKIFAEAIDAVKPVALMVKPGMQPEGVQYSQTLDNHGRWVDVHLCGLLAEDWRASHSCNHYECEVQQ